jgi:hypothetical protein
MPLKILIAVVLHHLQPETRKKEISSQVNFRTAAGRLLFAFYDGTSIDKRFREKCVSSND